VVVEDLNMKVKPVSSQLKLRGLSLRTKVNSRGIRNMRNICKKKIGLVQGFNNSRCGDT